MRHVLKPAQAGTIESNDIFITVAPAEPGSGIKVQIQSPVLKKYGNAIRQVIEETVRETGIADIQVVAVDKGALDCTIRARVKTAIRRAGCEEG